MAQILAGPLSVKAYKLIQKIEDLGAAPELTAVAVEAGEVFDGISALEEFLRVHLKAPYQPNDL